jgi:hypothetical protein
MCPSGTGGGSRSPAAFELGNNVAAQFEREDSVEEDDDDEEDSDVSGGPVCIVVCSVT